jgi:protein-disulfide isomerase
MANKRVDAPGRKSGVVKASKKTSASNRAFYLLAGGIAVLGIVALTWSSTRPKGVATASPVDTTLPPVQSEGYVMGSPTAKLEVVEFGDFECPQCGRFATLTEPDVRTRLVTPGTIRVRYIDYPLPMHPNTWNASRAAACADEQGKFWEMHDAIYANQDRWDGTATSSPDKVLKQVASRIAGINTDQFNECVDTKKTQAKIQAHLKLAESRQISATPTFIFGGDKQYPGFLTYDEFKKLVDDAIAKAPAAAPTVGGDTAKKTAPLTPTKKSGND